MVLETECFLFYAVVYFPFIQRRQTPAVCIEGAQITVLKFASTQCEAPIN